MDTWDSLILYIEVLLYPSSISNLYPKMLAANHTPHFCVVTTKGIRHYQVIPGIRIFQLRPTAPERLFPSRSSDPLRSRRSEVSKPQFNSNLFQVREEPFPLKANFLS